MTEELGARVGGAAEGQVRGVWPLIADHITCVIALGCQACWKYSCLAHVGCSLGDGNVPEMMAVQQLQEIQCVTLQVFHPEQCLWLFQPSLMFP